MRSVEQIRASYGQKEKQIDFYATINEDETPHITMINSLYQYDEGRLVWGESSGGLSKKNQRERHEIGFLSLVDGSRIIWGKGNWLDGKTSGREVDILNEIPELKYDVANRYTPVHIIEKRSMNEGVLSKEQVMHAKEATAAVIKQAGRGDDPKAVSHLTKRYLTIDNGFKVLAFLDEDGYPQVLPVPQATVANANRIVFAMEEFVSEINKLHDGMEVAILAVEIPAMCSVLLHGVLHVRNIDDIACGLVDVRRIYNPMMPVPGYIYPPVPYEAVVEFEDVLYEYNV